MNTYRIYLSLFRLINGSKYWDCIHFDDSQQIQLQIIRHQGCPSMSMDYALEWLKHYIDDADHLANRYYKKYDSQSKTTIDEACNNFILSLIKKQLVWSGDV
jgi:hypothetical protein